MKQYVNEHIDYNNISICKTNAWKLLIILTKLSYQDPNHSIESNKRIDEDLLIVTLECYRYVLHTYSFYLGNSHTNDHDQSSSDSEINETMLKGPYLAQIIQNCLQLSKHSSKRLAQTALLCLNYLYHHHRYHQANNNDWRAFIPGIFSNLHSVCSSGFQR
jgi:hypothetical protein